MMNINKRTDICFGPFNFRPVNFGPFNFRPVNFGSINFGPINFGPIKFGSITFWPIRYGPINCSALTSFFSIFVLMIPLLLLNRQHALSSERQTEHPGAVAGDTVWVIENFILEDKQMQFEEFLIDFWMILEESAEEDDAIKQAVRATRVLAPNEANEDGSWSYFFIMDPVISGVDYNVLSLLERTLPENDAAEMISRLTDTQKRPQKQWITTQSRIGTKSSAPDDTVWVIRYPVYEEKKQQFEDFAISFWNAGSRFIDENPDVPDVFSNTRVLFPAQPDDTGDWSYFIIADPFIPGSEYRLQYLLEELFPEEEAARRFALFEESLAGPFEDWRLRQSDMSRAIVRLQVHDLWNQGVEKLYDRNLSTSREYYLSAAEIARNNGLNLEESFSHQFISMAAGITGEEALANEHLERSYSAASGDEVLEEFHNMTAAVTHAGLGNVEEAQEFINLFDVDEPLTNPYAANVTYGVVVAATGDVEYAREISAKLEDAPAYQNTVKAFMIPAMIEAGQEETADEIRDMLLSADIFSFWDAVSKWKVDEVSSE